MFTSIRTRIRLGLGVAPALIVFALPACNGSDNGDNTGPEVSIQVTASPPVLTLQQGSAGSVTLALVRGGGFTGEVAFAVEGLPTGVSATVAPPVLTGATTTATVTCTATASAATGTSSVTVRASAAGVGTATTTFSITVNAIPNFTLAVTPTALSIERGASGAATMAITRTNFSGAVALVLESPVAGITATFTPATVTDATSAMSVNVAPSVAAGSYSLTIKGTAAAIGERSVMLAVAVTAPPASIALSLAPTTLTVPQGGSGTSTVTVERTNFTDVVALALDAPPTGITGTFIPASVAGTSSVLTVNVASTVTAGNYSLVVKATAAGLADRTATLGFTVTAVAATEVEFQFCSTSDNPSFFAYQDGAGAWTPVASIWSNGVYRYRFNLTQNRGGVFHVHGTAPYETQVSYATAAELVGMGLDNCVGTTSTRTAWLQIAGIGNGQQATLSLGGVTTTFIGGFSQSPAEFRGVRSGLVDFFGARESILTGVPGRLMDVRNLNPSDGSTLPFTADFNSAAAYDPAEAQLTVANGLGDNLWNFTRFFTANGAAGALNGGMAPSTAVTRTWYGVPANRLQVADLHAIALFATPSTSSENEQRYLFAYAAAVQPQVLALGPRIPTPTVTSIGTPAYRRLRVQGVLPTEYRRFVTASFEPSSGGNEITVATTGAYLVAAGGAGSFDLTIPDLTALGGFPFVSTLPAGEIEVTVNASGWSGLGVVQPIPTNGTSLLGAVKQVKLTVQ